MYNYVCLTFLLVRILYTHLQMLPKHIWAKMQYKYSVWLKNIQWMWSSSFKYSLCKPQSMTQYPKYRNDHFNWFSVGFWVLSHWRSPARSWPLLLQSFGSASVSCSSPLSTICCGCTFCCAHLPYPRGAHCSRLSHGGLALTSLV